MKNVSVWRGGRLEPPFLPGAGANPIWSEPESAPGPQTSATLDSNPSNLKSLNQNLRLNYFRLLIMGTEEFISVKNKSRKISWHRRFSMKVGENLTNSKIK